MSKALIELHYLPSIQYLSQIIVHDHIVIEQQENYQKGSYRNRCHLAGANGLLRLSVPLAGGKNQQQPIDEVGIDNSQDWQTQHWRSIQSAYGKTPFFEHYADEFRPFFQKQYTLLFEWNRDLLLQILEALDIETTISWTKEYNLAPPVGVKDLRNSISPKDTNTKAFSPMKYPQAFEQKNGFLANLSILDLIFCMGPQTIQILESALSE